MTTLKEEVTMVYMTCDSESGCYLTKMISWVVPLVGQPLLVGCRRVVPLRWAVLLWVVPQAAIQWAAVWVPLPVVGAVPLLLKAN